MATTIASWMFAVPLLGLANGLRTMTPIAVLCWFAHLGLLPVQGTWAAWTARPLFVAVFTLFALGEYVGDKLPMAPNRTDPPLLIARLVFGGLVGSIAATAMHGPGLEGALLGVIGAAIGTFGGFMCRTGLVRRIACPDWPIALSEDLFAICCAFFALHLITS